MPTASTSSNAVYIAACPPPAKTTPAGAGDSNGTACPPDMCCMRSSAMAEAQASRAQCPSSGQQNVCKPLSKNQLLAFQDAILQKETSFYNQHCTMNNGGCQDNIGDPAAPEAFTPTDLKSTSGYTLIPIGASGGGSQELYSNQLNYLINHYNSKGVNAACATPSPGGQSEPALSLLTAAQNRANHAASLFGRIKTLATKRLSQYIAITHKINGKEITSKIINPPWATQQKIINAIQTNKPSSSVRAMVLSYITEYGYGQNDVTRLLSPDVHGNITTSESLTGLNRDEITNMFIYALFMQYGNTNLASYFQPPMTSGYNYYTGIGPFAGGGDDNEAMYDFMTQAMLHSASAVPTKTGQVNLTWSTHSNLTKYLIEIDETHGVSHQMTKCFLDIAHQNLIENPKTFSSQDCSKGIISTCSVAGANIPLWVLRAAETQNAGSSPTTCSPALTDLGTPNDPYYPATAGQDYMHYYQQLHPILPVASNKS